MGDVCIPLTGGHAGHTVEPVERAGCYAAGGKLPWPSAVLMTAVIARAAGVRDVWVASPSPAPIVFAAAYVAGVDSLLAVGGPAAIAAFAYGAGSDPACDAIVGFGDRSVTAAKQFVAGRVAIDVLEGPNELCVLVDDSADARLVAADMLAQAEHENGIPMLVSLDADHRRSRRARIGARNSRRCRTRSAIAPLSSPASRSSSPICERAIHAVDEIAPAHLQLSLRDTGLARVPRASLRDDARRPAQLGVFGDYGAGPNYVIPTARGSRSRGGLSVFTFLRVRAWLEITTIRPKWPRMPRRLRGLEGFEAHARAAEMRAK